MMSGLLTAGGILAGVAISNADNCEGRWERVERDAGPRDADVVDAGIVEDAGVVNCVEEERAYYRNCAFLAALGGDSTRCATLQSYYIECLADPSYKNLTDKEIRQMMEEFGL